MSNLENSPPEKWVLTQINELLVPIDGNRTLGQGWSPQCEKEPSISENDWGVLKTTAIQAGSFHPEHNKKLPKHLAPRPSLEVAAGDFLITCAGPRNRCGVACLVRSTRKQLMISGKMYRFRLKPELIDSKYAEAYFQTQDAQIAIDSMKTGGSDSGLNLTHERFRKLQIPLAPVNEQTRIVAEIEKQFSRLDEAVANLKRVKANLKRYKAAVLKAAVEGKLTEEWRQQHPDVEPADKLLERILAERRKAAGKGKYKEPVAPDTSGLPELPAGWVWANLGQLAWSVKDGPHYSPKYSDSGIPFISGGNIRPEGIDFSSTKFISQELHAELSQRCKPEYGDLLYTKGGTTGIARINTETRDFNVWVHVAVLKLVDSVEPFYLQHALNSTYCYKQSQQYTHGVGNQDLGLTRMVWITIPLPPLTEQKFISAEIERRLSIVAEAGAEVDNNLRRADRLRQSILKQAFSGQLVPQDPHDEPASVLLERIKNVGANLCVRPPSVRRQKSGRHAGLPLQKPQSPAKPKPAVTNDFPSLDAVLIAILNRMQPGKEYSRADLADALGLSTGRWNAAIQELKRRGQVRQVGERRGAHYSLVMSP